MPVDHVKFNPMASNVSWKQQLCKHHTVLSVLEWSPINRMFLSLVLCVGLGVGRNLFDRKRCRSGDYGSLYFLSTNEISHLHLLTNQRKDVNITAICQIWKVLGQGDEKFTCPSLTFPLCSSILPTSTDTFSELCTKLVYSNLL